MGSNKIWDVFLSTQTHTVGSDNCPQKIGSTEWIQKSRMNRIYQTSSEEAFFWGFWGKRYKPRLFYLWNPFAMKHHTSGWLVNMSVLRVVYCCFKWSIVNHLTLLRAENCLLPLMLSSCGNLQWWLVVKCLVFIFQTKIFLIKKCATSSSWHLTVRQQIRDADPILLCEQLYWRGDKRPAHTSQ